MFCNRCGTELQPDFVACPKCGRRIGDPVSAVAQSRLENHLRILGVLWIVIGGLFFIPAAGLIIFGRGAHLVVHSQDVAPNVFSVLVSIAGGSLAILACGGSAWAWG
jgi:zinc-ribbon domain